MRVLVLTSLYPPHAIGGYELACHDVMSRWAASGDQITVLTGAHRIAGDRPDPDIAGLTIRRQLHPLYALPPGVEPPRRRALVPLVALDRVRLRIAVRETQPDVISIWHFGMLSLALLRDVTRLRLPVVTMVCDMWPTYAVSGDPTPRFAGRPATATLPGRVVFCSAALRDVVAAGTGQSFSGSEVVWLGVDRTTFPVSADGTEPQERPWRERLLYVGRLVSEKGVVTLVRALAHLPPTYSLTLLGPGSDSDIEQLERVAAEIGARDRVTIGSRPRSELRAAYYDADAVVFPSEWPEPFGIVPLEAMACDTPVAATGTGGAGEYLVDGSNCLLFTPRDPASLAAAVLRMAGDAALRRSLVLGGRRAAATIDTDRLAESLRTVHEDAANRRVR